MPKLDCMTPTIVLLLAAALPAGTGCGQSELSSQQQPAVPKSEKKAAQEQSLEADSDGQSPPPLASAAPLGASAETTNDSSKPERPTDEAIREAIEQACIADRPSLRGYVAMVAITKLEPDASAPGEYRVWAKVVFDNLAGTCLELGYIDHFRLRRDDAGRWKATPVKVAQKAPQSSAAAVDNAGGSGTKRSSQERLWKDQQNGYFAWVPPEGWQAARHKDSRTKVTFAPTDEAGVYIRFIVREASAETFRAMLEQDRRTAQQWQSRGVSCTVQETTLLHRPCSQITLEMPDGGRLRLWKFLANGLHFNVAYGATSSALWKKHQKRAAEALQTIVVRPGGERDPATARRQKVDWYLRYAELTAQYGSRSAALALLEQASEEFPDSERIRMALKDLRAQAQEPLPRPAVEAPPATRTE